jgi:hypothetical protein
MDSVLYYVQNVSIPMLVLASLGVLTIVLIIPKRVGFFLAIFLIGAWLNVGRFSSLPAISTAAKFTFMVPPLMLLFCASGIPGPRRQIPLVAWIYLICPIIGLICIAGATDKLQGIAQFGAMFFLAAAGITLYRVAYNNDILTKSLTALFLGLMVPVVLCAVALVVYRGGAFRAGINRFEPFGMGSNQYVQILASTCALAACGYFTIAKTTLKAFCLAVIGVCLVMVMISGSRQGLVITGIVFLPMIWNVRRNPIAVAIGVVCCVGIGAYLIQYTDNVRSDRITDFSSSSGRYEIAMKYLDIVRSRPMAGLMSTHGLFVDSPDMYTKSPHNSYIRMAYLGGALLAVPLGIAALSTLYSAYYVIRNRGRLKMNHLLLSTLAALMLAIYVQGLVNDMIYLSSTTLPFLHFFISCFFIGTAKELKRQPAYSMQQYNVPRSMPAMG